MCKSRQSTSHHFPELADGTETASKFPHVTVTPNMRLALVKDEGIDPSRL